MTDLTDRLFEQGRGSLELSEATLRDYASALRGFSRWCADHGHEPLPADPQVVAEYLVDGAYRLTNASLYRILRAIGHAHTSAGHASPTETDYVRGVFEGLRDVRPMFDEDDPPPRELGLDLPAELEQMLRATPDDTLGRRDRALLLVGRGARLSRPQIVDLNVSDVDVTRKEVTVRTQERGQTLTTIIRRGVPEFDVSAALKVWISDLDEWQGPLFRSVDKSGSIGEDRLSPQAVTVVLRRAAKRAGLPSSSASTDLFSKP